MSRHQPYSTFTNYRPAQSAGNLYYVRLKADVGTLYKLGYTTLPSVDKRLAFKGEGHERLIDKVLFFSHFDDAAEMEAKLHRHFFMQAAFSKLEPERLGPLYGNGQSELYVEDILGLDLECSPGQIALTKGNIASVYPASSRLHLDEATTKRKEASTRLAGAAAGAAATIVLLPFVICMMLWRLVRPKKGDSAAAIGARLFEAKREFEQIREREIRAQYGRREPNAAVAEILRRITAAATVPR